MEMWEQKVFEIFLTNIPQAFIFLFLYFSLTGIKIEKKSLSIFSIFYAILTFLIRPYVNFGVHSIVMLFVMVIIATKWGKISVFKSIVYGVICFLINYLCEWSTFIILGIFNFNMELLSTNAQIRAIIGFIPLTIFFVISLIVYYSKIRLKKQVLDV